MIPVMMRMWKPHSASAPLVYAIRYTGGSDPAAFGRYDYTNTSGYYYDAFQNTTYESGGYYWAGTSNVDPDLSNGQQGEIPTVIGYFNANDQITYEAFNQSTDQDSALLEIEFRDSSDNPIVAMRSKKTGNYAMDLLYGPSLADLSEAATASSGTPNPQGIITFTSDSLVYTNVRPFNYHNSFTYGPISVGNIVKAYVNVGSTAYVLSGTFNASAAIVNIGPA